jgi:hypothetical protein
MYVLSHTLCVCHTIFKNRPDLLLRQLNKNQVFTGVFTFRRDQKIPLIWFVANSGGILGLCMGFSMVTVSMLEHKTIILKYGGEQRTCGIFYQILTL